MTARLAATLLGLAGAMLLAPAVARADAVTDWNVQAQTTIFAPGPTAHGSTLSFAMVHGAIYDAVNSIDHRYEPYLDVPRARRHASQDAAAGGLEHGCFDQGVHQHGAGAARPAAIVRADAAAIEIQAVGAG